MNIGCVTIVTPIGGEEQTEALKHFLRTEVEPHFDPDEPRKILKCRSRFPFDRIGSLHFCSFAVLDGDAEFFPRLVFEATFDGQRDHFLDALLSTAPGAIDDIYRHCEGYPASGRAIPELVKEYLARHDEGAHAFYLGSPGRTVAQIKDEAEIRDKLASSVCEPWSRHKAVPATFAGIQQELQDVVRNEPGHRWGTQLTAAVPWEIAWRKAAPIAAVLVVLSAACLLGALVVWWRGLCDWTIFETVSGHDCKTYMDVFLFTPWNKLQWVDKLVLYVYPSTSSVSYTDHFATIPFTYYPRLWILITVWAGLRFIELSLRLIFQDPRRQNFLLRVCFHVLIIQRYFLVAVFVGYSILMLDEQRQLTILVWPGLVHGNSIPSPPTAILTLVGAGVLFLVFQHRATSLKLAIQFMELRPAQEIRRRWLVDTLHVGMVVVATFALLVLTRVALIPFPSALFPGWIEKFFSAIDRLLDFYVYAFVGLIVAYVIGILLFVLLRIMEHCEGNRFSDAEGLAAFDNASAYAREEGGINTYQNHLVSLTHVKPGLLRWLSLRLTLFVVGRLSRFWYNKGKLGGIPTILSARWVLIDGGRRLLFLDHYSGAWNNYLNEFIDMTAVFGLNAIWTNTFIKVRGSQYAFPETEYYLWKGAQVERPFKAYVRHSQIETLVWYSAYPTLSTVNVNTNTEVRRSLFKAPVSCEIDSLLQNL